uniref:Solute carrier organic anion transporter family member n=1 Tax=Gopherus evgoodei TaxID=1825980 RepID=A0A8C4XZP1_9SAUR
PSQIAHRNSEAEAQHISLQNMKIFLGALAFSFFAKGFSGSYMKSMSTQIERRFEISSSVVGIIDGSFEIGNLMVMILVSYLGSKVHRPKVIAAGCLIMSFGTFLSVMPHFLMGRYNYERIQLTEENSSTSLSACSLVLPLHHPTLDAVEMTRELKNSGNSYLWIFVLMGNLLRGIGEAPIMPLGVSYVDDFSKEENSAFYIGNKLISCGMVGPTLGFLLGSFCANLWVDVGVVDLESLTINPKDTRWVGAWWLGLVICGAVSFLSSLPFWFLPYSLPKEGDERNLKKLSESSVTIQEDHCKIEPPNTQLSFPDFLPTLKKLLGNPVFLVYLFLTILQYNSMVGLITFETKFMEQQFNVSVSRAIFLIGVILLPITILGMFLGGFIIKKFKLHITGMVKFGCATFIAAYLLNLLYFTCDCEVLQVAGLTVSYSGFKNNRTTSSADVNQLNCNSDCSCVLNQWDPVCGDNGITYMTACFAGCKSSIGTGKNMVFHNCSCVQVEGLESGNSSAVLGQCQRESCTKTFPYFLALLSTCALILALGGTPTYMIISVSPDLKSFAVGIDALCGRILGGLPAPIYFGALIDQTCLKWGTKRCGGSGSCRVYDTKLLNFIFFMKSQNCLQNKNHFPNTAVSQGETRKLQN